LSRPVWAFSDESERANTMLFGVVIVRTAALLTARRELRTLLLPGQRRLHTAKESPSRRRRVLRVISDLGLDATVFTMRRRAGVRRIDTRHLLLEAAASEVVRRGALVWVLDHPDPAQAARDRHTIDHSLRHVGGHLVYDHQPGHDEPLLWAVDAIVWAVGAGGEWRRLVSGMTETRELAP
jgi:hypothetical protein